MEQWVFAAVTCDTQARKSTCYSTTFCMPDFGCSEAGREEG